MSVFYDIHEDGTLLGIQSNEEEIIKDKQLIFSIFFISCSYVPFALAPFSLFIIFCVLAYIVLMPFLLLKTDDIHPPKTGISVHFSDSLT